MGEVPESNTRAVIWSAYSAGAVGVLGLVGLAVAARWLGADGYATFAVVWGVYFSVGGVYGGFQHEVSRTVTTSPARGSGATRLVFVALPIVGLVALTGGLVTQLTLGDVTTSATLTVGFIGYGMLTYVLAILATRAQWRALSLLLMTDAALRAATIWAFSLTDRPGLVPMAVVSGSVLWIALLLLPVYRGTLGGARLDQWRGFIRRCSWALLGAGLGGVVVAGLPMLFAFLRGHELGPRVGVILAAATWIRSGFLLLVYAMRPVVLRHFLVLGRRGLLARFWFVTSIAAAAYTGVVSAAAPALLPLLLGGDFTISSTTAALLALGAGGIAFMVFLGLALLAEDHHFMAALGWFTALAATGLTIVGPGGAELQVIHASWVGPWCGVIVHAAAYLRLPKNDRPTHSAVAANVPPTG